MSRRDGNGGLWLGLLALVAAVGVAVALTVGGNDVGAVQPATSTAEPASGGSLSPGLTTPAITPTAPVPTPTAPSTTPTTPKTAPTTPKTTPTSPKTTPTTTTGG